MRKFYAISIVVALCATLMLALGFVSSARASIKDEVALMPLTITTETEKYQLKLDYAVYTVRRGDHITHIARTHSSKIYKLSVAEIISLNNLKNKNWIYPGQKLQIPMYYAEQVNIQVPIIAEAAIAGAVAPKEAALTEAKSNADFYFMLMWLFMAVAIAEGAFLLWLTPSSKQPDPADVVAELYCTDKCFSETPESEKFLSYPDEIKAKLQKCTGWDVIGILEAELVEIPRNPGSTVMNKKKLLNLKDLIHNNPELYDMPLEQWSGHLAAKINGITSAQETA